MIRGKRQKATQIVAPVIGGETVEIQVKNSLGKIEKQKIIIRPPGTLNIMLTLRGQSVIVNSPQEGTRKMADKQAGVKEDGEHNLRAPKNPQEEFELAKHKNEDGVECLTGDMFRVAFASAAVTMEKTSKRSLNRSVVIAAEFIPLKFRKCIMRTDLVRQPTGGTNIRWRPQYLDWEVQVPVQLMLNEVTLEAFLHAVTMAGLSIGVGAWRPGSDKGGYHGRFDLVEVNAGGQSHKFKQRHLSAA